MLRNNNIFKTNFITFSQTQGLKFKQKELGPAP